MNEVPFHATRMGRTYYEHSIPELIRQLKRVGDAVERLVELNGSTETGSQPRGQESESSNYEEPT